MKKLFIASASLFSLTLITGAILTTTHVSADDVVDDVTITVPMSCTMTGTGQDSHTASINPGTYNSSIGTTTITALCNDNEGFSIYAIGYTNTEDGNNVLTDSNLTAASDIATSTATSGNNSAWAMKLAVPQSPTPTYPLTIQSDTEGSFSSFHTVPDDYTLVAKRTSGTDIGTNAEGSTLTTTYQAYISQTQPAGTYTGKVKYTMVHPHDANAPIACKPNGTTISTIVCMQDISSTNKSSILTSMTEGTQYTLKDKRDGKEYTIAKLADGKVWMTQNLDLDIDSSKTYTNEDTDIGYNTSTGTYGTASWTPSDSTVVTSSTGYWESSSSGLASYDPGDLYWTGALSDGTDWDDYYNSCDYNLDPPVCDETLNPTSTYLSSTGIPQYHIGNYYNWTVAIAMNNSAGIQSPNYTVNQSICPSGWTLPGIGTGDNTFYALWDQYGLASSSTSGNNNLWSSPLYFTMSGNLFDSIDNINSIGVSGAYWAPVTAPQNASYFARGANFGSDGSASPSGGGDRFLGQSVRCLVR